MAIQSIFEGTERVASVGEWRFSLPVEGGRQKSLGGVEHGRAPCPLLSFAALSGAPGDSPVEFPLDLFHQAALLLKLRPESRIECCLFVRQALLEPLQPRRRNGVGAPREV